MQIAAILKVFKKLGDGGTAAAIGAIDKQTRWRASWNRIYDVTLYHVIMSIQWI